MTTIDDLDFKSISDMSKDEAIEHLRQIRLSRRTPKKKVSTPKQVSKAKAKKVPKMSAEQAAKLLKMLED